MSDTNEEFESAIAIVGMACRFPGARNLAEYWRNLRNGVESIASFGADELDRAVVDPAEASDPHYVPSRAILDDVESFDAALFGFSPREAELTDPQHRVFLECAWEALEHAGYDPKRYAGQIGVYGGAGANTYLLFNLASSGQIVGSGPTLQAFIHNKNDHLTARTAYKLNLRGPAVTVQTACSTSLVAVATAAQALLNYQVDMALAGACTITVPQRSGYLYHERGIGSPDGHCRAFDADAKGTVGGNGAGVVLLKRYSDAVAAGDTIYAVLRGAAVNNDGAMRVGYTAPSVDSQAEVIALAQALAGVSPESIGYVEAHGTGTPIGDPIEVEALTQAFRRGTDKKGFCAMGSVKTNIGHLDTSAGMAGLIKTVLSLRNREIPPSLHFDKPNPRIDFANSPFYVNSALRDWPAPHATPRRAGVSSFGLGGTNAHVVLEEAPPQEPSDPARPWQLLVLSGQTVSAMEAVCRNVKDHLKQNPAIKLSDVAYTLQIGRQPLPHRRMLVCRDVPEAIGLLETLKPERVFGREQERAQRPLTFMFPGQGAQFIDMGAELYRQEPLFRAEVDRACELLVPHLGLDLRTILYPDPAPEAKARAKELLDRTAYTQPALFVIEHAMAQLWMSWGVRPDAMIGHSIGEYVAACLAGVFSLEDALGLVAARGRLIQRLPAGAMLAVPLPAHAVRPLLGEELSLAAVNGLGQCVVSGTEAAVAALEAKLTVERHICRRLQTSHAFHSAMMDPIVDAFREEVAKVARHAPSMRYLSNVTGTWITAEQATDPAYWAAHLRGTVRFADGLAELLATPNAVLLEVGPGRTLRTLVRWHPHKKPDQFMLASLPHPSEKQSDYQYLLHTVGHLWLAGVEPDWDAFYAHERRHRLPLPTYPFERKRYWIDAAPRTSGRAAGSMRKRTNIAEWFYVPSFRSSAAQPASAALPAGPWLIFEDAAGLGARLGDDLRSAGHDVVRVRAGERFAKQDDQHYTLDPRKREDYDQLVQGLEANELLPRHVVHAWSISPEPATSLEQALTSGLHSLTFLAQALFPRRPHEELRLTVLTHGIVQVLGSDIPDAFTATVLGACQVIPREYPKVGCRLVDVELTGGDRAARLVEELRFEDAPAVVAHRGGRRWVRDFEPLSLPEAASPRAGAPALRTGGVYVITGGMGGLGLEVAGWLARSAQAKLVLLGRSGPNDRTRARLRELEKAGAEVLALAADVTDEPSLRAALGAAKARFGAIHGVFHAAGVPGGGLIQRATPEGAAAVLAPKIEGTLRLDAALDGEPVDFFVVFSSLTTVVGRFGQIDYTAANAFLDAFAQARMARTGRSTTAIDWGAWESVGMAAVRAHENGHAHENGSAHANGSAHGNENGAGERLGHPLLERRIVEENREVFMTDFHVDKHWVLDEHRILGNAVIPGVAYFEMARAALGARAEGKIVELQDVLFLLPLRVRNEETREVRMVLEHEPEGHRFAVRSEGGENGVVKVHDYAVGYVALRDQEPLRAFDLAAIRARCNVRELLLAAEEREEDLGPRWHSVQRVNLGNNEVLLYLELPEAFEADFDHMKFHPALLDRAAGIAKNFLAADGHYLPLTYKKVQIKAPLQRKIYSWARFREEDDPTRETITFDIVLTDEAGRGLVEIEGFSQKRVNDPGAEIRALAQTAAVLESEPAEAGEIAPHEGVEALGRILAARIGPQVVVSVRDLQASIEQSDRVARERILRAAADRPESAERTLHGRPNLSVPYVAPRNEIETKVAETWQRALGIDRVGIHDNFFELGGDSLVAIQVIARLERVFKVTIPPVSIFEGATISKLVETFMVDHAKEQAGFAERQDRGAARRNRASARRSRGGAGAGEALDAPEDEE
ncbi:SDR family NAD(P)-dependent oxidoreductase [Pendulispora albinea]|uniref:SDR family NAD(P)-dependent oxidoreductase n=1 Tax=Pendulispora albinea TaxID=2741071 RepID=A0ABZ2MA51_9BACT